MSFILNLAYLKLVFLLLMVQHSNFLAFSHLSHH